MATGASWTASDGYLSNPKLSEKLRFSAYEMSRFRQFCEVKEGSGKMKNETMNYDKILKLSTGGGTLVETSTVPSDNYTIVKGTLTITEYGNKIPWTGKVEALTEFDIKMPVQKRLRDDIKDTLDDAAGSEFTDAEYKAVLVSTSSVAFTTDGTATSTGTANLHTLTARQIVSYMKKQNIPFYDSNGYICIGSVDSIGSLYDAFQSLIQYTTPEKMYKGEIGRYYQTTYLEENNVLSNAIGSGSAYGEAVFFGDDAVMEGISVAEELRSDPPTDLGRSKSMGWYYLGGFQKVWSYSTDAQENIVHVTSA